MSILLLKQLPSDPKNNHKFPLGFKVHLDKSGTRYRFRILDSFFNLVEASSFKYKTQKEARAAGKTSVANAKAANR